MTEHTEAGLGHNEPPPYDVDQMNLFQKKLDDFADAAGAWLDLKVIENEGQAERLNDFITGGRRLFKQIEGQRTADKKPHLDAGKLVDSTWKRLTGPLQIAAEKVKPMLSAWGAKKAAEAEAAKRVAQIEAAKKQAEIDKKLAAAAKRHDVVGEAAAQEEAKEAAAEAKAAERMSTTGRVSSATGGGRTAAMRTYYTPSITSRRTAFLALEKTHGAELDETILRIASSIKRADAKAEILGIEFSADKRIA